MARPKKIAQEASRTDGYSPDWGVTGAHRLGLYTTVSGMPLPQGRLLLEDMNAMQLTDETVGAMLWCIASVMGLVKWKHEPRVDGVKATEDPEAIRLAAFADTLLGDMKVSYADHVEEALTMLWAGFAPCEVVTKQCDGSNSAFSDRLYRIHHLPLRDPLSVMGWEYDKVRQEITGMHQQTYSGGATIPAWKLMNYRTSTHLDSPYGRPLLVNAWKVWKLKNKVQESEAVGIERDLCGLPVFKMPIEDMEKAGEVNPTTGEPTPEAMVARKRIQMMIKAVKDMRFGHGDGLIYPSDTYAEDNEGDRTAKYAFDLVTTAGQRSIDARTVARDHDRAIARVAGMQFLHLGDRSSGSYGLSDDQSSLAIRSFMTLAVKIATEWNRKPLPLVWTINAFDRRYMPALVPSEINKEGLTAIGTFLRGIGAAVGLWNGDIKVRESLLTLLGMEFDPVAQRKLAAIGLTPPPDPNQPPAGGGLP